jgi:hypothetical protein
LPVLAIYILHREKIAGTAISDELVLPRERRLIEEADWRVPIAALHFGVSLEEATQLLLGRLKRGRFIAREVRGTGPPLRRPDVHRRS